MQEAKIKRLKSMKDISPDKSQKYDEIINKCILLRDEIESKIKSVDGGILSEILFQKYIFGKTLEEISYILNYSKRQTERLHLRALEKAEIGDEITITTDDENVFAYTICDAYIVNDLSEIALTSTEEPTLVLVTCYPFRYSGCAPQKYVVIAKKEGMAYE